MKLSNTTVGKRATYTVTFTTSSTGALEPSYGPNYAQIQLDGPTGTIFPETCGYTVTDVTTGMVGPPVASLPTTASPPTTSNSEA